MNYYNLCIKKSRGKAKAEEVVSGISRFDCLTEGTFLWHPTSNFEIILSKSGNSFGHSLYDGHWEQFFFISKSVINVLVKHSPDLEYFDVKIIEPIPSQFTQIPHPQFYSINYRSLNRIDYDLVNYPYEYKICPECGEIRDNDSSFFNDIINNTVAPRPFDFKVNDGAKLFRVGATGLGCNEELKDELENIANSSFTFSPLLTNM